MLAPPFAAKETASHAKCTAVASAFSEALSRVPAQARDPWFDSLCGFHAIPEDDPALPHGSVPYLPCPVATVLAAIAHANVTSEDVFVDIGSGIGRVALLVNLVTGAQCIGLELQPKLVAAARERANQLNLRGVSFVLADAVAALRRDGTGTVFFLYCPFSGTHLEQLLEVLEHVARRRSIRICCVQMSPLDRPWLTRLQSPNAELEIYRSTFAARE